MVIGALKNSGAILEDVSRIVKEVIVHIVNVWRV